MHIAVTGARGFIGRNVVRSLIRLGVDVTLLVRAKSPSAVELAPLSDSKSNLLRVRNIDLRFRDGDTRAACGTPDVLIHLAWGGLPNYKSQHHLDQEFPMHAEFLSSALASGIPHVLAAGTCFEYGLAEGMLDENLPTMPRTAYAEAKVRLHELLRQAADLASANLTWLRPFYVYGPGQRSTTLWGQLQDAINRGDSEFPMSLGEQGRDYLEVSEMGALIAEIAIRPPGLNSVLNVCSGMATKVQDLVAEWIEARGSAIKPRLGALPYSPDEPMHAYGSLRRLRAHMNQTPNSINARFSSEVSE